MTKFIKNGANIKTGWPEVRNKKMKWGNNALKLSFEYEQGHIFTTKGTQVPAYKYVAGSLLIELFDRKSKEVIPKPLSYFDQFNFDLSYNCFGYCFADSDIFIPNPTAFIEEEYEEVDYENAELIIFKEHKGFGDNGEEILQYFHAVKILPNGNVSFKPGINALVENVNKELAINTYNFNHEIYLKKK